MRRRMLFPLLLLVSLACRSSLQDIDPEKFSYEVDEIRPHFSFAIPVSASIVEADATLRVRNENDIRVKLEGIDFELLVNDRRVMRGRSTEKIDLPARGSGTLQLTARASGDELRELVGEIADRFRGGDSRYTIRGNAHYRTIIGVIDIPFSADARNVIRR
ncbi:MAG TPA: LEA type 2 family protein [Thermoanaerobaculia bacterium]|nr:LEA type 2 family protein [Thermoanaerobaculia bacterium]